VAIASVGITLVIETGYRQMSRSGWVLAFVVVIGLTSGCVQRVPDAGKAGVGSSSDPAAASGTPGSETGTPSSANAKPISLHGSSTVYPICQAFGEQYREKHPEINFEAGISGTSSGFKKLIAGEIDICNASRAISNAEIESAKTAGIEWLELEVAVDGLTVVVHPENTWCECLSVAQLKSIWEPNSQIKTWKQIDPAWPDLPLKLFGADSESGTFDYFTEVINGEAKASRTDYTPASNDNVLVQGVASEPGAMGYFGFGYYVSNQDRLKAVAVRASEDSDCVLPSAESVENKTYTPLARGLFIYVNRASLARAEVRDFLAFCLSDEGQQSVTERKFVKLNKETQTAMQERLTAALAGP
jgi:phosphate transport system substrate-binding protein